MKFTVSAPRGRTARVEVFEPRQDTTQEEVLLDTFDLEVGETRDFDVRSATAAYRIYPGPKRYDYETPETPQEASERMQAEDEENLKNVTPVNKTRDDEMQAGRSVTA